MDSIVVDDSVGACEGLPDGGDELGSPIDTTSTSSIHTKPMFMYQYEKRLVEFHQCKQSHMMYKLTFSFGLTLRQTIQIEWIESITKIDCMSSRGHPKLW